MLSSGPLMRENLTLGEQPLTRALERRCQFGDHRVMAKRGDGDLRHTKFASTAGPQTRFRSKRKWAVIAEPAHHTDQLRLSQPTLAADRHGSRGIRPNPDGAAGHDAKTRDEVEHLEIALAYPVCSLSAWHV